MWTVQNWIDYEVIDASNGEKLERFGDFFLVRPDPQVIWDTPREHAGWKKLTRVITAVTAAAANGKLLNCLMNGIFHIKN